MNTKIIFLVQFFILSSHLYPQDQKKRITFEMGSNFNESNLVWSIAGNLEGHSPNVLSELKFNSIKSLGYYLSGSYSPLTYLRFSVYYHRNEGISGNGLDTDYRDDNRTNPTFEKNFMSNEGGFTVFNGGIGTPIELSNKLIISPTIFYYLSKQQFYLLADQMKDLKSIYQADMHGMKISIDANIRLSKIIYSSLTLSYQIVDYKAKANWNLIEVFKHPLSFSQASKGSGFDVNGGFEGEINNTFSIITRGSLSSISIRKGIDTSYLITEKEISTQFNGAKNIIYGLQIGIRVSI
jgi:hypothetical protein